MPRERRQEAFEREVEERVQDLEALDAVKVHPYVSEDGTKFTTVASEADFPGGAEQFLVRNRSWDVIIEDLQEETKTDAGRAVLLEAYRRFSERQG